MPNRIYTSLLCLLLAIIVFACGKKTGSSSDQDMESSGSKANTTIIYTNSVVDYLNEAGKWLYINNSNLEALLTSVETKNPNLIKEEIVKLETQNIDVDLDKPITTLSSNDQKFFKEALSKYDNTLKSLEINAKELERYIKEGDYKADNFDVGKVLAQNIKNDREYLLNNKDALLDKIHDVADQAEVLTLQNHPFREPIMSMRADIKLMNEVYDILEAYNNGEATLEQAETKYKELSSSVDNNKKLHTESLKAQQAKFDNFYNSLDKLMDTYKTNIDIIKTGKKIEDIDFQKLNKLADTVIRDYNLFIG